MKLRTFSMSFNFATATFQNVVLIDCSLPLMHPDARVVHSTVAHVLHWAEYVSLRGPERVSVSFNLPLFSSRGADSRLGTHRCTSWRCARRESL